VAAARGAVGEAAFAAAWAAGAVLTPDGAIAEALAWAASAAVVPLQPVAPVAHGSLTPREVEVLRLIAAGRSDREIAAALGLSYRTVTNHVASILTKLDAPSRSAAAAQAVRRGLA
jgi:DNA-binding CsgD family transcriptional regulator